MDYLTDHDYEIAASNGISKQRVYQRFYMNGWSKERSINEPINKRKIYDNYQAVVNRDTFYRRIRKGMTPEQAATQEVRHCPITDEQLQRAMENGINKNTLYARVFHYHWDIEEAITTPLLNGRRKRVSV